MSIPITESKPDGVYRAPNPQVRYVRKMIRNSSPTEKRAFVDDLIKRSQVEPRYFAQLALGLLLLLVGIIAKLPLLILIAAITSPVLNPIIGLVTAAARPSGQHLMKSLFYLVITFLLFFGVGWLAKTFLPSLKEGIDTLQTFASTYSWLEWLILAVTSVVAVFLFLYRENIPSVASSTVLVYLIFIPITLAGLLLAQGETSLAQCALLLGGSRLFVSIIIMIFTIWIMGFPPRHALGWLTFSLVIIVGALLVNEMSGKPLFLSQLTSEPTPAQEIVVPSLEPTAMPTKEPTTTAQPTASPTPKATATKMPDPTPTQEVKQNTPQIRQAKVVSESGVMIRESPSTSSLILAYLNNGEYVTLLGEQESAQGILWEKVQLDDGTVGWASSQYLVVVED
jgi:hypothetical protein